MSTSVPPIAGSSRSGPRAHPMIWVTLFWLCLALLYVPQQLIMAAVRGASDPDPVIVLSNGDDSDMGAIANGVAALHLAGSR